MKTITIGRGDGANIIIDDEMISRRHAILKVYTFGKMELVDMGKNGTFVNGIKLRPNVPFPVSRKDTVSFAEVSTLDWSMVPDNSKYLKIAIAAIALLLLCLLVFALTGSCEGKKQPAAPINIPEYNNQEAAPADGAAKEKAPAAKEEANSGSTAEEGPATKDEAAKDGNKDGQQRQPSGNTLDELFPQPKSDSKDVKSQKAGQKGTSKQKGKKPAETEKKPEKTTMPII